MVCCDDMSSRASAILESKTASSALHSTAVHVTNCWPAGSLVYTRGLNSDDALANRAGSLHGILQTAHVHPNGACEASSVAASGRIDGAAADSWPYGNCREPLHIMLRCACTQASHRLGCGPARRLVSGNCHSVVPASVSSCQDAERLTSDRLSSHTESD